MSFEKQKVYNKKSGGRSYQNWNGYNKRFTKKKVFVNSLSSLADEEKEIFSKSNKEFFEKKPSQAQSEGTSQPKTEAVKFQQKKVDVKGKAPMGVEKKVVKKENVKIDKFYKRVAVI
ncbi:hypothetical protein Hanom_Chr02g00167901 [Helianthus anomalus]